MELFSWLEDLLHSKTIELDHPYFGKLKFESVRTNKGLRCEYWCGELETPLSAVPITIFIEAGSEGPADLYRIRVETLFQKFPQMQSSISRALFQAWKELKSDMSESLEQSDGGHVETSATMGDIFKLESIKVFEDEAFELGYGLDGESSIWPDLELYLCVDHEWHVSYSGAAD